jgi:hypothetical protein
MLPLISSSVLWKFVESISRARVASFEVDLLLRRSASSLARLRLRPAIIIVLFGPREVESRSQIMEPKVP